MKMINNFDYDNYFIYLKYDLIIPLLFSGKQKKFSYIFNYYNPTQKLNSKLVLSEYLIQLYVTTWLQV